MLGEVKELFFKLFLALGPLNNDWEGLLLLNYLLNIALAHFVLTTFTGCHCIFKTYKGTTKPREKQAFFGAI